MNENEIKAGADLLLATIDLGRSDPRIGRISYEYPGYLTLTFGVGGNAPVVAVGCLDGKTLDIDRYPSEKDYRDGIQPQGMRATVASPQEALEAIVQALAGTEG